VLVQVVNLHHYDTDEYERARLLREDHLDLARERLLVRAREIRTVLESDESDTAVPNPGGLCQSYGEFLHRCPVGQAHVARYAGADAVKERISTPVG
jgi:hypothetical protein